MRPPIVLPAQSRPLPRPCDLDRLLACRYAVMFVAGRSGSGLIQAHLDGHRQIAQIPAIWKFHDFLTAESARAEATPAEFARAFVDFAAHAPLFDTRRSTNLAGQLGATGDVAILVNRGAFEAALVSALGVQVGGPRRALYAAVLAYEWCLGRDLDEARVVFHHLHHGEWLWPELLIETCNLGGLEPAADLRETLKPDLVLVPLRDPRAILRSYPAIAAGVTEGGAQATAFCERLVRLLPQDWLRARAAAASGSATRGVRLEDIKADLAGTFAALCRFLGVDDDDPALRAMTYYGHAWTEDTWSVARRSALAANRDLDRPLAWQDEAFAMGLLGPLVGAAYDVGEGCGDRDGVLHRLIQAADDPPVTLYPGFKLSTEGRRSATDLAWERVSFAERFCALAETLPPGALQLCLPAATAPTPASPLDAQQQIARPDPEQRCELR
jgi:hypothetical protein